MECSKKEKQATFNLLTHLHEVQTRRLYAEIGYNSLWEYVVKELGYSESAAAERCNATRLCFSLPEAHTQIKNGDLSLTSASKLHRFFYADKKRTGKEMDIKSKRRLLENVAGKSTREVEKEFLKLSPTPTPKESERYSGSGNKKTLNFSIDEETIELLDRLRELRGTMNLSEAFKLTLKHYISKNDPLLKKERSTKKKTVALVQSNSEKNKTETTFKKMPKTPHKKEITLAHKWKIKRPSNLHSAPELRRYKNTSVKAVLLKKAQAQCEYISKDGKRCSSKTKLQIDHIIPLGKNGSSSLDNLRVFCPEHNRLAAIKEYGAVKMNHYLN